MIPETSRLPPAPTGDDYDALPAAHPAYARFAADLARTLGLPPTPDRLPGGSLPVLGLGPDAVVKLFPPFCVDEARRESDVLDALSGVDEVPAPRLLTTGTHDGWGYVVMSRLPGRLWSASDDALGEADHAALARQLGGIAARLHATTPRFDWPERDWSGFEAGQRAGAAARQRRLGLPEAWVGQIDPYLAALRPADDGHGLLHTELMREHAFVERGPGGWRITGIFDFEPARVGPPGYDLASVGLFVARGEARLMHAFLDGYGTPESARDRPLQRRCLGWALLHQYSHLPWYLERLPAPEARTLDDLARRWWPL